MNTLEPIYEALKAERQWSPADLSPPFDLPAFIAASYAKPTNLESIAATVVKTARKRTRT